MKKFLLPSREESQEKYRLEDPNFGKLLTGIRLPETDDEWKRDYLNNFFGRFPGGFYRGLETTSDNKPLKQFEDIDQEIENIGLSVKEVESWMKEDRKKLTHEYAQAYFKVYIGMRNRGYQKFDLIG